MAPLDVFVHEKALCESDDIGTGTFVETGAVLGDRVMVKNNVLLWDKVTIEDDVFLGPNAVFTNATTRLRGRRSASLRRNSSRRPSAGAPRLEQTRPSSAG